MYNILCLVQEAYKSVDAHQCDASAFQIAYWQEHQKLNEALEANKALALHLQETQSKVEYYEQTIIPNYHRAEEDAEKYAHSLRSKLEALQQRIIIQDLKSPVSPIRQEGDIVGRQARIEQPAGDNSTSALDSSRKRKVSNEDGPDRSEEDKTSCAKGNRAKSRRITKPNLTIST